MKFSCKCGNSISDQTDFLTYKAHLLADQDFSDLLEKGEKKGWLQYYRTVYQCDQCGRIWIQDHDGNLQSFASEDETVSRTLLRSIKQEAWKRGLVGIWESDRKSIYGKKGHLQYSNLGNDGFETIEPWEEFEKRYFEVFEELKSKNIIRGALLKKDGVIVHRWDTKDS